MKTKRLMTALASLTLLMQTTTAQTFRPNEHEYDQAGGNKANQTDEVTLESGNNSMTINVSKGGKILSFKHRDQEVLSQSRWPESFGSTFWTSPQKEWNWPPVPEFDKQPYTIVKQENDQLTICSHVSERLGFSITKNFKALPKQEGFLVTYTIKNESQQTRSVAPWEITRVTNSDGLIFFEAENNQIWPSGLMDFKPENGGMWYQTDEAKENRKVNADGKGWLAYCADNLLLVKQFNDLKSGQAAPGEAEVQVYVNRGKTYIELESQGAYTELLPGASFSWSVHWYLQPIDKQKQNKSALMETVRKLINS